MMNQDSDFFSIITGKEEDTEKDDLNQTALNILPVRNAVLFPGVVTHISAERKKSIELIKWAHKNKKAIGLLTQTDENNDDPGFDDFFEIGTLSHVLKVLEMPDGGTTAILQGKSKFKLHRFTETEPFLQAEITHLNDIEYNEDDEEFNALVAAIKETALKIVQMALDNPQEAIFAIKNFDGGHFLINYITTNSDIAPHDKQALLEINDYKARGLVLLEKLSLETQKLSIKDDIKARTRFELDQQQREYFLNQQIKTIQEELGGNPAELDMEELEQKAAEKNWTEEQHETFEKELRKLERLNMASPEYSVHLNYLEFYVELPWDEYSEDNFDLKHAQGVLDKDHFGLEKVKERILEHLAVLKLKKDLKAPILCLVGPPGVGKTSLGKSIAEALGRQYVRMALGGLHDESEIRGHRKTYIGALPGRILQNIKKAGTSNPVFVLDEIDKIGKDFRGDPSFALLEVLDPEQNNTFYDNYLEEHYDLSKVMFVATANSLSTISPALLDRMEIIDVSGYIIEEKTEIAKRHLIPKQLQAHGVTEAQFKPLKPAIEKIITDYTRESGVRALDKKIAELVRKQAKKIAFEEKYKIRLTPKDIREMLGAEKFVQDKYEGNHYAGLVTGLAWTASGGAILYIESGLSRGKGGLSLTGNLGDVMKESAKLAFENIKSNAAHLSIPCNTFDNWNVHIHVPEGAIPKDGPSAGITMATSLASVFTQRKVKEKLAMTGEITLRGKVLPVGGIKEKILAAKRANIQEIILSKENKKDIDEIKPIYIEGLKFHYVEKIQQVWEIALLNEKVDNPLSFAVKKTEN